MRTGAFVIKIFSDNPFAVLEQSYDFAVVAYTFDVQILCAYHEVAVLDRVVYAELVKLLDGQLVAVLTVEG